MSQAQVIVIFSGLLLIQKFTIDAVCCLAQYFLGAFWLSAHKTLNGNRFKIWLKGLPMIKNKTATRMN
jgi:hypothetical protein